MRKINPPQVNSTDDDILEVLLEENVTKSHKMKRLFDLGLEVSYIAMLLDVRYNFVYNVISLYLAEKETALQKKDEVKLVKKKELILSLFEKGRSYLDICKALKVHYSYVWRTVRDMQASTT